MSLIFFKSVKVDWDDLLTSKLSATAVGTVPIREASGNVTITTIAPAALRSAHQDIAIAPSGASATTTRAMRRDIQNLANSNAVVDSIDGTSDYSIVRFISAADANTGIFYFTFTMPSTVPSPAKLNFVVVHSGASGIGGNVSLTLACAAVANNAVKDPALTFVWGAAANPDEKAVNTSANQTITTMCPTNCDSLLTVAASTRLRCALTRVASDVNDTLNSIDWFVEDLLVRHD